MTSPKTAKKDVTHTLSGYAAIVCAKFPRENCLFTISPITIFACKKKPESFCVEKTVKIIPLTYYTH